MGSAPVQSNSAPASIHRRSVLLLFPRSESVQGCAEDMTSLGLAVLIRAINSLASDRRDDGTGLDGFICRGGRVAGRLSCCVSGPWQTKRFSARIGRISRLYSGFLPATMPVVLKSVISVSVPGQHSINRCSLGASCYTFGGSREIYRQGSSAISPGTNWKPRDGLIHPGRHTTP